MHQQFANRGSEEELCYQVVMDVNNASLHFLQDIGYANVLLWEKYIHHVY